MRRIKNLLSFHTTRNVIINTGGNYLSYITAVLYTIIFARSFSPQEFGVLSLLLMLSYICANIFSFGMPAAVYAHIPALMNDKKSLITFIKTNFLLLITLSFSSLFVIFMLSGLIDTHIIKSHAPRWYFALALAGSALFICQNYIQDILYAAQKFLNVNIAINIGNLVKITLISLFTFMGVLSVPLTIVVLGVVGPLTVIGILLIRRQKIIEQFLRQTIDKSHLKLSYTFTYFVSSQIFYLASRTDLFLISYFLTRSDVGYFGLSQRIALAILTSVDSITQVLSPQFATASSKKDVAKLLRRGYMYMLIPVLLFIIASVIPSNIYTLLFTSSFNPSITTTRLLNLAYIPFGFIAVTLLFFLYTIKKPFYILIGNSVLFVSILLGNAVLIPRFGIIAPPLTSLVSFLIVGVYILCVFVFEFNKLKE